MLELQVQSFVSINHYEFLIFMLRMVRLHCIGQLRMVIMRFANV